MLQSALTQHHVFPLLTGTGMPMALNVVPIHASYSSALRLLSLLHTLTNIVYKVCTPEGLQVFHDFDKCTTLMMHASPALVAWCVPC